MHKRTRRILFWLAVGIFGLASVLAVVFAEGYTFDFNRNTFVRTGAIAVTANVDAQLSVDDRHADPMSFLTHQAGVNRLLPGTYTVRLVREGYSSWRKTALVQEGLLTDFPTVMLLATDAASLPDLKAEIAAAVKTAVAAGPFTLRAGVLSRTDTDTPQKIAQGVLGMNVTDDTSRVMWWTRNEVWVLWRTSTNYQPFRVEGERHLITRFSVPIVRAGWFRDRDHIAVDLGGAYRILETDTRGGINIIRI